MRSIKIENENKELTFTPNISGKQDFNDSKYFIQNGEPVLKTPTSRLLRGGYNRSISANRTMPLSINMSNNEPENRLI